MLGFKPRSVYFKPLLASILTLATVNANALQINVGTWTNVSASQRDAFTYAANQFSSLFANNISLNINVVGSTSVALASSSTNVGIFAFNSGNYSAVASGMRAADTNIVLPSFASVATAGSSTLTLSYAELQAMGYYQSSGLPNGTISFNSTYSYNTAPNTTVAGQYSLIAMFEHEISEVLGRISSIKNNSLAPLDFLRYTSPGVLNFSKTASGVYLSLDGGVTQLGTFSAVAGQDLGDFTGSYSAQDPFSATLAAGAPVSTSLTANDIMIMQALGYKLSPTGSTTLASLLGASAVTTGAITSVPEPESLIMMLVGLFGIAYRLRKVKD